DLGVDEGRIVVLPTGLVLLRPAVVVDGDHLPAALAGRRGEVQRRLAEIGAHFEDRPGHGVTGGPVQGGALVVGHETGGFAGGGEQIVWHAPMLPEWADEPRRQG